MGSFIGFLAFVGVVIYLVHRHSTIKESQAILDTRLEEEREHLSITGKAVRGYGSCPKCHKPMIRHAFILQSSKGTAYWTQCNAPDCRGLTCTACKLTCLQHLDRMLMFDVALGK